MLPHLNHTLQPKIKTDVVDGSPAIGGMPVLQYVVKHRYNHGTATRGQHGTTACEQAGNDHRIHIIFNGRASVEIGDLSKNIIGLRLQLQHGLRNGVYSSEDIQPGNTIGSFTIQFTIGKAILYADVLRIDTDACRKKIGKAITQLGRYIDERVITEGQAEISAYKKLFLLEALLPLLVFLGMD